MATEHEPMPEGPAILWMNHYGSPHGQMAEHFLEAVEIGHSAEERGESAVEMIECAGQGYAWHHPLVKRVRDDVERTLAAALAEMEARTRKMPYWRIEVNYASRWRIVADGITDHEAAAEELQMAIQAVGIERARAIRYMR